MDYNTFKSMDAGSIAVLIGVNLLITVIAYLLVPIALALLGKKYDAKKIKRINLINCIVVWLAFRIIEIAMGNDMSTGAAVFLWGAVGYGILKKHCLSPKQPIPTPPSHSTAQSYTPRVQLSAEDEVPPTHEHGLTYGSDIKLEQNTATPQTPTPSPAAQQVPSYVPNRTPTTKYCSRCGHTIDPVSKKCTGCGKQYFKGFTVKNILITVLCILLIASIAGNIWFYTANRKAKENDNTMPQTHSTEVENNPLTQSPTEKAIESGQIGVYVFTIDDKFSADFYYALLEGAIIDAKNYGIDQEKVIIDTMDKFGGIDFHIIEPGDFVDEIDNWCFSSARKIGDLAIIENPYGYSICYISCIGER